MAVIAEFEAAYSQVIDYILLLYTIMSRTAHLAILLLALPLAWAGPDAPAPARPERDHVQPRMEREHERFQHRQARIREALERGDLTPAEAALLRQRLEMRRERLERWRILQERLREAARSETPAMVPATPASQPPATPPATPP
ncbi:hypothetical protein GCM10007907_00860 [Chitinimonas prasina]|uniref:Periplasmic heavy metal sensor n=2 Tax=Chitinimonas prasina TaxID=1434937 RepID=A0ABQ5YCN9_9NEIS|nr:hypothetical protein GCM10007907_00860 [Chitinimonas prasina]